MRDAPINVVKGLPDDRSTEISRIRRDGRGMEFQFRGLSTYPGQLMPEDRHNVVWVGPSAPSEAKLVDGPIFNAISDPDICPKALAAASSNARRLRRPWFNHPDAVRQTGRHLVSARLQGITGLRVPRVSRIVAQTGAELLAAIEAGGHTYPVIVRNTGHHNSNGVFKLEGPHHLGDLQSFRWSGTAFYVTDFVDYGSRDALHRKFRFVMVGGEVLIRHRKVSEDWNVHDGSQLWTPSICDEEKRILNSFDHGLRADIQDRARQIYERMRLDLFGIDCGFDDKGDMVLFESNTAMSFFQLSQQFQPIIWTESIGRIREALRSLAATPERWTHAATSTNADRGP